MAKDVVCPHPFFITDPDLKGTSTEKTGDKNTHWWRKQAKMLFAEIKQIMKYVFHLLFFKSALPVPKSKINREAIKIIDN